MKKRGFTRYDVVVTILSLISYIIDVGSDILLIVTFFIEGNQIWASLSMAFVALSTFLMQVFSFYWHANDKSLTCKTFFIHALFLAPTHRYIEAIRLGFRARQTRSQQDLDAVFRANNDICLLRLIESFVESAPQLILQLYIILRYHHFHWVLGLSTVISLLSLAWSMTAYTDGLRLAYKEKYSRKWLSMLIHTTWQMAMISARIMALVIFSTLYQAWIFLAMGIHWCLMTFWITLQNADFGETPCEKRLFNSVSGFIYIFCFLNLKDSQARWRILAFHIILLGENSLLVLLWFLGKSDRTPLWMEISTISIVFGGYVLGGVFMLVYYGCCHPTGLKTDKDKDEMAYWFRRISPMEKKQREPIFEGPGPSPHVTEWLNASLNLSGSSKMDRFSVSHDPTGRSEQLEYSQNLGRSIGTKNFQNSSIVSYLSHFEPGPSSTQMDSEGDVTRDSAKLSYISASSSRHLIDSSSNLSTDTIDQHYHQKSFERNRSSSTCTTEDRHSSSYLDTPLQLFAISAIAGNSPDGYLSPKHTSHDSFYSSPEFKTGKLSPLDAKKLWEESQDRIDQTVAQTITIVTHTDLDKRSSYSTVTWRKHSQQESDSSHMSNSLHGEYDETGFHRSVSYQPVQLTNPVNSYHSRVEQPSMYNQTPLNVQDPESLYFSKSENTSSVNDRFKILTASQQEVSTNSYSEDEDISLSHLTSNRGSDHSPEEPQYINNISGTQLVTDQPTLFSPWSPTQEDNIPYIDESVVDEEENIEEKENEINTNTNDNQDSVLSDWFADISSLHHTKPDRFWLSSLGVMDASGGQDRSYPSVSTTADESSRVSTDPSYTDTSVEPRSFSSVSYQDRSQSLSINPDSSISLYQYSNSQSQEESLRSSYTEELRTTSSHMTSGYCGSKVDITDRDSSWSSHAKGGESSRDSSWSSHAKGRESSRDSSWSSQAKGRESSMDRGLQSSSAEGNSATSYCESDSVGTSVERDYSSFSHKQTISPIYTKTGQLAMEDSGYQRSKSTSGGDFIEDDSLGSRSRDDPDEYSLRSRSDVSNSRSFSDMSGKVELFTKTKSKIFTVTEAVDNDLNFSSSYTRGSDILARSQDLDDQIVPDLKSECMSDGSFSITSTDISGHNDYSVHHNQLTAEKVQSSRERPVRRRSSIFNASRYSSAKNTPAGLPHSQGSPINVYKMKKSPLRLGRNIDLFNVSSWRNSVDKEAEEGFTSLKSLRHIPETKSNPIPITTLTESPYKFRPRKPNMPLTQLTESPYKFRSKQDENHRKPHPSDKENEIHGCKNTRLLKKSRRSLPTKPLYLKDTQNEVIYSQDGKLRTRRKSDMPLNLPCYMYSSEGESEEDVADHEKTSENDLSRRILQPLENTPGFSPIILPEELHKVRGSGYEVRNKVFKPIVSTPVPSTVNFSGSYQELAVPAEYSTVEV